MATTGEWGGLQVRFDIPEIRDAVDAVNSVFEIIIVALDIALSVLNIIKAFVSSLLNPVRAIIQELISALQNLLLDFRQAGFYTNGDWNLLGDTTREQLRGGYAAYQNRMLTRLTDRTDLSRPNFSPSTTVLALFLYTGADISFVDGLTDFSKLNQINQLVEGFAGFFGIDVGDSPLPIPTGLRSNFAGGSTRITSGGVPSSSISDLRASVSRIAGRTSTILQWGLAPSPGSASTQPTPVVPPDGFLIELSVFAQGLYVGYLAPVPSSTGGVAGVPSEGSTTTPATYATGMYKEADTGRPLQVFGGLDSVSLSDGVQWSSAFDSNVALIPGARPAFFLTDLSSTQLIQTNVLQPPPGAPEGRYYNQRTLYVPHSSVLAQSLVGGTYSFELSSADFPWQTPISADGVPDFEGATQATSVYVRVLSCSDKVSAMNSFRWNVVPFTTPESAMILPWNDLGVADRSQSSQIIPVTFPTAEADAYLGALQTALTVMLLSRSDLVLPSAALNPELALEVTGQTSYTPTGLETFAQNLLPVLGVDPQDYFSSAATPQAFGLDLRAKVGVLTDLIIERQGNLPQNTLQALANTFTRLTEWEWADSTVAGASGNTNLGVTILSSLLATGPDDDTDMGMYVAKNAASLFGYPTAPGASLAKVRSSGVLNTYDQAGFGSGIPTMPDATEAAPFLVDLGVPGRNTPIRAWYARDLIPAEIYTAAQQVLSLAVGESTAAGGWISVRPFQSVGNLAGIQNVSAIIQNYLEAIAAGIQGGADLILNFISMLEQRVNEIQELIRRIDTYLTIPLSIEIPDAVGLALVANGMDGVVSGLVSATNKPTDGPGAYAGGLVVLGGGLPALITDLMLLLIAPTP
jgi:hypothetical protein